MRGYVYILQSIKNGRYYIGSSIDVNNRFSEHSNGLVRATKFLLPLKLVFSKEYSTVNEARKIEYKLKRFKSRKILEKIITDNDIRTKIG